MYDYLVKHNIIAILPMELSFHFSLTLADDIKISNALLKLNYSHYSPYINPEIISYHDGVNLHLWFYETEINAPFIVPEGFLFFNVLQKTYDNSLILIKDSMYKIFILKDKKLVSSLVAKNYNDQMLKLSMDEYSISNLEEIDGAKYKNSLPLYDVLKWKNPSLGFESITSVVINLFAYPLSFLLLGVLILQFIHGNMLSSNVNEAEKNYTEAKVKNDAIRSYIVEKKNVEKRLKAFLNKELVYPDVMLILEALVDAVKEDTVSMKDVKILNGIVSVTLESNENPVLMLNKFIDIKLVKNVVIKRSYKPKRGKKIVVYQMQLKALRLSK